MFQLATAKAAKARNLQRFPVQQRGILQSQEWLEFALAMLARLFRHAEITHHGGFVSLANGRMALLAQAAREPLIQPSLSLSRLIRKIGIRKLIRQGFGRRIIEKISRGELVKPSTYRDYEQRIEEYVRRRKRPRHSL